MAMWKINMLKLSDLHWFMLVLCCVFLQLHRIECVHHGNIVKRMDIASCLGKFDIKNDMIIKTEESTKLGAKFLESADALTKVECLHLCCETENCDVFVYEEKGQGECFLFHCGPAQNFRCKFSKHANYTSAIFSVEKKVPAQSVALKKVNNAAMVTLSQNEIELKSLKRKSGDAVSAKLPSNDATVAVETTTIKAIAVPMKNATMHCSRFQFQCHSGDCIAVYNACDGIPQCDDGSDEGPECQSITRTPEATQNKASADGRVQLLSNSNVQNDANIGIGHNREDPLTAPQWPNLNQPDLTAVHQYTDDTSKAVFNRNGGLQITDTAQQIARLQPDMPRFPGISKDNYAWNGLTDPNIVPNWPQQQMPQFPLKPLQFPQKPAYTQYQKSVGLSDQTQLNNQQQYNVNWPISESNLPNVPSVNHPNHDNEEVLPEKEGIGVIKDVPVHDRKKDGKGLLVQNKGESKSTEDSDYNNEDEEETTTEPPKKKKKHRKVNKIGKQSTEERVVTKDASAQQMKMIHSGLQVEFMDHDGEADRPGGAVVSLALGILITIGLVMVISCRTTAVRKRVRRGKGYAHDADFLVNGMYL
ncbi:uncharacterized protein LOC129573258 [Sitodiplosis mosellana]|uniref:uncharacterized protein LOC129573258 n=1 Tax=Sitodiplosis mosellana TaxID=263140 RepID=UPI002443D296|nr:uncharacterized protein LOC129573258 [Sitodiplosis mosellana]